MPGQLGDSALTMLLDAAIEEENIEVGLQVSELQGLKVKSRDFSFEGFIYNSNILMQQLST